MATPSSKSLPVFSLRVLRGKLRVRALLRGFLRALLKEQASPNRLGAAVGLGVLVGCTPLLGFQVLVALGLAWLFRLNRLAILLGIQVSTPPLTPFVLLAGLQLGALVQRGQLAPLTLSALRARPLGEVVAEYAVDLTLGGLLLGVILGLPAAWATAAFVRSRRENAAAILELSRVELASLGARLKALPRRWDRGYAYWKVRMDPVYARVLPLLSGARDVVDLGAGLGLLEALLARAAPDARVRAVEWDERKLEGAKRLLSGLPQVTLERADVHQVQLGAADAILLLDVLHYSPVAAQEALVRRCVGALNTGGRLIIRDLDAGPRGSLSAHLERVAVRLGWNLGQGVHPWGSAQLRNLLEGLGLSVTVEPMGRGLFRANALVVATKAEAGRSPEEHGRPAYGEAAA